MRRKSVTQAHGAAPGAEDPVGEAQAAFDSAQAMRLDARIRNLQLQREARGTCKKPPVDPARLCQQLLCGGGTRRFPFGKGLGRAVDHQRILPDFLCHVFREQRCQRRQREAQRQKGAQARDAASAEFAQQAPVQGRECLRAIQRAGGFTAR